MSLYFFAMVELNAKKELSLVSLKQLSAHNLHQPHPQFPIYPYSSIGLRSSHPLQATLASIVLFFVRPLFLSLSAEPLTTAVPFLVHRARLYRPLVLMWPSDPLPLHFSFQKCHPDWTPVISLWLTSTGAEHGQVWSDVDIHLWDSDLCESGQCPTLGTSDAPGGQVPHTRPHGAVEGAPGPQGPQIRDLRHVSQGLKGLGPGHRGPGGKRVGSGSQSDAGQSRAFLHPLSLPLA